jgi:hypothetical protein
MYFELFGQMKRQLAQLRTWLEIATKHAEAKKFDPNLYLQFRLAPDQFPFVRQIQIACDTAKNGVAKLTGKEAPAHEDNEKTIADAKARIGKVLAYLETFSAKDFEGAEARLVTQPRWAGKTLTGHEFALQHMVPNLFFHVTTAYSIMRSDGIEVGKKDFLGPMPFKDPA